MSAITDPLLGDEGRDIVGSGIVKSVAVDDDRALHAEIELQTRAYPFTASLREEVEAALRSLDVSKVDVAMRPRRPRNPTTILGALGGGAGGGSAGGGGGGGGNGGSGSGGDGTTTTTTTREADGLDSVASVIAVSSCKGGVGKSTVAVNLAFALAEMGGRVGIFDADIFGPSLPTMASPANAEDAVARKAADSELIEPIRYGENVKMMSYGFAASQRESTVQDASIGGGGGNDQDDAVDEFRPTGRAAVMRGPMVSNVVKQLLSMTDWGELDYLVLDMPPGTGDIQLA